MTPGNYRDAGVVCIFRSAVILLITAAVVPFVIGDGTPVHDCPEPAPAPDVEYALVHYPAHNETYAAQLHSDGSLPPGYCWRREVA